MPLLVIIATCPPLFRPNSAVAFPVNTLNSASPSGFIRIGAKFEPPAEVSFASMPSTVKFQARSRAPLTCTPPPVFAPLTTPGCRSTRSSGFLPACHDQQNLDHRLRKRRYPLPEVDV